MAATAAVGVSQGHDEGPVTHGAAKRLAVLGADHDLDAQCEPRRRGNPRPGR